jgi:hypothetical protein
MKAKLVPCTIAPGFFESEFYVFVGKSSAFVDRKILTVIEEPKSGVEGHGLVCVFVIDMKNDQTLVELPGEPVVGGLRTWVPSASLQEAAAAA